MEVSSYDSCPHACGGDPGCVIGYPHEHGGDSGVIINSSLSTRENKVFATENNKNVTMFSVKHNRAFADWLLTEMKRRRLSQSELARRSGISRSTLSNIINDQRGYGEKTVIAIAHGLDVPESIVLQAAGILSDKQEISGTTEETYLFKMLDDKDKEEIIYLMRFKLDRQKK